MTRKTLTISKWFGILLAAVIVGQVLADSSSAQVITTVPAVGYYRPRPILRPFTWAPAVVGAPVATYYAPPVATYYAPPVTTYYAPAATYVAPTTTYYAPAATYVAPTATYYAPRVIGPPVVRSYYAPTVVSPSIIVSP
jgi:hypothetical protein